MVKIANGIKNFGIMNAGMFIYVPDLELAYNNALQSGAKTIPGQEPRKQTTDIPVALLILLGIHGGLQKRKNDQVLTSLVPSYNSYCNKRQSILPV